MRWLSFKTDADTSEENVIKCFQSHLVSMLDKWKKKYKNAVFYFCKDEKHENVWRHGIYPEYKATRGVATDILREIQGILSTTVSKYGTILAGDGLEADDVAYLTVRKLRSDPKTRDLDIVIITSDRDYLQMLDDHITILDGGGKVVKGTGDPSVDLWCKILMGDVSDNIPPVCKGCGKKTAEALAKDVVKRNEYIDKHKCSAQLERNRMLISMDCIPQELADAFYAKSTIS